METIKQWFESAGSYRDGVELLIRFSKNKTLQGYLNRRVDMPKLRYELGKIIGRGVAPTALAKPQIESSAESDLTEHPEFKVAPSERITYENLPEELKPCFEQATEAYRNGRRCHYLLKDVALDDQRKGLRMELLKWIDQSRQSWEILEHWKVTGEIFAPKITTSDKVINLSGAATQLTRHLEKLDNATDPLIAEQIIPLVLDLIKVITENGRTISAKTKARLQKHNIEI